MFQEYTNCSCVSATLLHRPDVKPRVTIYSDGRYDYQTEDNTVTLGTCTSDCNYSFIVWIGIMCVLHGLTSSGKIGNILVNYR